ncbi:GNAT family N-acetyltransferase [Lacinutrix neustonica]|uniref:GNAT family N-acetyltransferase n=1 Tax=Lacinutrix neustonica TaxID=2980107 RepID=A0A9E8SFJ7_9FLAO|nr:GNAT family N-acetyltransferase [Lacinutrix neustonica]WAC00845.1 GNAT family N-acetyltransferase [Lacinutrix neustonica]
MQHDFDLLKKMNDACGHCIAKHEGKVIGYALSMLQAFKNDMPLLIPMFNEIDHVLSGQNRRLNYIAMGQICIDKSYRRMGVFRGLYLYMAKELSNEFHAIITEVDSKNTRSSEAHRSIGFKVLSKYTSNDQLWEVIILEI